MSNFTSHVPLPFYNVLLISICFIYVLVTFFSTPTCFVKMLRTCQTFTLPVYFLNNHLWCYSDTHLSCFTSPACFLNSCDVCRNSPVVYFGCLLPQHPPVVLQCYAPAVFSFYLSIFSTPTSGVIMRRTCCIYIFACIISHHTPIVRSLTWRPSFVCLVEPILFSIYTEFIHFHHFFNREANYNIKNFLRTFQVTNAKANTELLKLSGPISEFKLL